MQFNKFKLSAIALAVAGIPTLANAALYNVERVDNASSTQSAVATAISPNSTQIATQVLSGPVGLNYSEELPFMMDVEHFINSEDDLFLYCRDNLGYNTCEAWAEERWFGIKDSGEICDSGDSEQVCSGGLKKEIDAWNKGFTSNSVASVNGTIQNPFGSGVDGDAPTGTANSDSTNVVINAVTDSGDAVGVSSSPYYKSGSRYARAFQRRGFYGDAELKPPTDAKGVAATLGQTNANGVIEVAGRTIVFGSASVANMADPTNGNKAPEGSGLSNLNDCSSSVDFNKRACQYFQFANQASVWLPSDTTTAVSALKVADFQTPNKSPTGNTDDTAQASVNAAALVSGATAPTMVGFSTYNDNDFYARAVKFMPVTDFATCLTELETNASKRCWTMSPIPGIDIRQGGDIIYSYTEATDINDQGLVVGIAKNARLNNGAYAEKIFINKGNSTTLLGRSQSALFFDGYNGTAAAINNNDELVGKVDVENVRDRSRRQRGYIYAHGTLSADFDGTRGWLLDDLTNGAPDANAFRIAEAFDINDNGDIAASAFYCAGGYSSTAHDARCNGEEELVAVKLTRQNGGEITPRSYEENNITRSGGGMGVLSLGLLAFGCFLRRKK
ncbi:DUF3466 domain-containing protein [Grimontia hollisae]|nr:DUF3466 family protein [Grimontia hollisae]AMG31868.1 DUF3466 domain-containing protein [Grimontia hollisae]STO44583.1 Protein of uncharacterised function (DUF3466) [Grimontia hollisae]